MYTFQVNTKFIGYENISKEVTYIHNVSANILSYSMVTNHNTKNKFEKPVVKNTNKNCDDKWSYK